MRHIWSFVFVLNLISNWALNSASNSHCLIAKLKFLQALFYILGTQAHTDWRWALSVLRWIPCLGYRARGSNVSSEIRRLSGDQWSGCGESQLCQVSDALMLCTTANMHTTFTMQEVTECLTGIWPLKTDIILQFASYHSHQYIWYISQSTLGFWRWMLPIANTLKRITRSHSHHVMWHTVLH